MTEVDECEPLTRLYRSSNFAWRRPHAAEQGRVESAAFLQLVVGPIDGRGINKKGKRVAEVDWKRNGFVNLGFG